MLALNGEDLRRKPLYERRAVLQKLFAMSDTIAEDGVLVFTHACRLGFEGIVSKLIDSLYRSGRSLDWVKAISPVYQRL